MLRGLRIVVLCGLLGIAGGVGLAVVLHSAPGEEGVGGGVGVGDGQPRLWGVNYTQVEGGRRSWSLRAEQATTDTQLKRLVLKGVEVEFYPAGGGKVVVVGRRGCYDRGRGELVVEGDVRIRTDDGLSLVTRRLVYRMKGRVVRSDGAVEIEGRRFRVRGARMLVRLGEEVMVLSGGVESVFTPVGSGPPRGVMVE